MEKENCKFCRHFYQHFVRTGRGFCQIECGHCSHRKKPFCEFVPCKMFERVDVKEKEKVEIQKLCHKLLFDFDKKFKTICELVECELNSEDPNL